MAEEMTTPPQTVSTEADSAPAAAVPAAAPAAAPASAAPRKPKKDSPLLAILTVFLIMVGIADAVLWGVVGYYLYQNAQRGDSSAPPQTALTGGTPAQSGSGDDASSDDDAKREALEDYVQEMTEIYKLQTEATNSEAIGVEEGNRGNTDGRYAEFAERTRPLCQEWNEKAGAIAPSDPDILEIHKISQTVCP